MEKLTARFVTTLKPDSYVESLRLNGITLYRVEYGEEDTKRILAESDEYFVSIFSSHYYENDVHGTVKKEKATANLQSKKWQAPFLPATPRANRR